MLLLRIWPLRISVAREIVWLSAHADGPSMTVRRKGSSASLISQVAAFHR